MGKKKDFEKCKYFDGTGCMKYCFCDIDDCDNFTPIEKELKKSKNYISVEIERGDGFEITAEYIERLLNSSTSICPFTVTALPPETHVVDLCQHEYSGGNLELLKCQKCGKLWGETHAGEKKYCECKNPVATMTLHGWQHGGLNGPGCGRLIREVDISPKPEAGEKVGLPEKLGFFYPEHEAIYKKVDAIISYLSQKEDSHE